MFGPALQHTTSSDESAQLTPISTTELSVTSCLSRSQVGSRRWLIVLLPFQMTNLVLSHNIAASDPHYCFRELCTHNTTTSPSWDLSKTKVLVALIANNPQTSSPALPKESLACIFSCIAPGNRCIGKMFYHRQLWHRAGQEEILNCFTPAHKVRNCILKAGLYGATSAVQIERGQGWEAGELCE